MAYYHCIFFDLDGTLLDFEAAERKALLETLEKFSLPTDQETQALYRSINKELWAALEKGQIKRDKLLVERFARFLKQLDAKGSPAEMNRFYLGQLGSHADTMPGALETVRELAEVATLAVASNGVTQVQSSRLRDSHLFEYMDEVFVSEQMGCEKPSRRFFDQAIKTLGVEQRDKILMVGDSLSADIKGGKNAGIATCWCNFTNQPEPEKDKPDYIIHNLNELYAIVMEEDELQNVGVKHRKHQF